MAVKWNKIYRGGVQRTTPETREVNYAGSDDVVILPGYGVVLDGAAGVSTVVAAGDFFYLVGEQLHGSVDDNQVGIDSTMRLYTPRSGDLYAGRAVAGLELSDDMPLSIDADGRFGTVGVDAEVHAYVDMPASAHPQTEPSTTVLDQLIPIKIK